MYKRSLVPTEYEAGWAPEMVRCESKATTPYVVFCLAFLIFK